MAAAAAAGGGGAADGEPRDGVPHDGAPSDGVPHDGAPSDGVPHDGAPSDGVGLPFLEGNAGGSPWLRLISTMDDAMCNFTAGRSVVLDICNRLVTLSESIDNYLDPEKANITKGGKDLSPVLERALKWSIHSVADQIQITFDPSSRCRPLKKVTEAIEGLLEAEPVLLPVLCDVELLNGIVSVIHPKLNLVLHSIYTLNQNMHKLFESLKTDELKKFKEDSTARSAAAQNAVKMVNDAMEYMDGALLQLAEAPSSARFFFSFRNFVPPTE